MKTKAVVLWALFVVCAIAAVVLNRSMMNSEVEYEEVQVTVLSAESVEHVNRKTGSRTTTYEIKVRYDDKIYDLENAHNTYMYRSGSAVTAYLANGHLYANVEGVRTSTPLAKVYFGCLFGSVALLCGALTYTGKARKAKAAAKE